MTVTPETVAELAAKAERHALPFGIEVNRRVLLDLARSWQAQHAELDRLRTIIASLIEGHNEYPHVTIQRLLADK